MRLIGLTAASVLILFHPPASWGDTWELARANAVQSQRAIDFSFRHFDGWIKHADPTSGLLPRRLENETHWQIRGKRAPDWWDCTTLDAENLDEAAQITIG
jgi:hypothetical protein